MKMLVADNEIIALDTLCRTIRSSVPDADIISALSSEEALDLAKKEDPAVAFLDIEMPGMSGLELAKCLKEQVSPKMNIIFTTGYDEYVQEAFMQLRASGYLMKPVTGEMILKELDNLRFPVELKGEKRVRIRAFGAFEVYIDNKPVIFHYNKTKEMLAYLIDRGGICRIGEIAANLWEDEKDSTDHRSYIRNMINDLTKVFTKYGCRDVILRKYGAIGIDESKIDCDYYAYRASNPAAVNAFRGEYMSQYSWAETTLASLSFWKEV
ncbi:MAG: response regulator [Lachnospiraceae bacterium]|nr:response regulator [Lachnospiraceae bacterium]